MTMLAVPQKLVRSLAVAGLLLAAPSVALAQLAPVAGFHYAARASDTGFQGAVNAGGSYSASVPLDFSPTDASLPVPISVVYGGKRMGAAGVGWDVPISYIYHDTTAAHRRPESATKGYERWTPGLLGETLNPVLKSGPPATAGRELVAERGPPPPD